MEGGSLPCVHVLYLLCYSVPFNCPWGINEVLRIELIFRHKHTKMVIFLNDSFYSPAHIARLVCS